MANFSRIILLLIVHTTYFQYHYCHFTYVLPSVINRTCRVRDVCVKVTECPSYMRLLGGLRRPLIPATLVYLRQQECGIDGDLPLVCCLTPQDTRIRKEPSSITVKPLEIPLEFNFFEETKSSSTTSSPVTTTTIKGLGKLEKWRLDDQISKDTNRKYEVGKEEEKNRRMEVVNQALLVSFVDDFFARRMLELADQQTNTSNGDKMV
ncbi:uncharacterized protein [Euwallacea fornicatus]|uniref:uncharacterized protein isoform X1 n=1 Tax=Euwallacea fornicatus TaxID=995702 RepID=UPI00338E4BE6